MQQTRADHEPVSLNPAVKCYRKPDVGLRWLLFRSGLNKYEIWDRDREISMRVAKQTIDACQTLGVTTMLFPFFGDPIELFNGRNLDGWKLTNPNQLNGWKAINGELVNTTPKLDFQPYSRYSNLRTEREFMDFNLQIEFKVPPGGNSGIYLRGIYEVQVVDRDSRMQGIQGVGAVFGRIPPSLNAGQAGDQWQRYDVTIVNRHATVILNGTKVIDNLPIAGCTNGALHADETTPGPIYLQGDHTAVSYRNIVLRPVVN